MRTDPELGHSLTHPHPAMPESERRTERPGEDILDMELQHILPGTGDPEVSVIAREEERVGSNEETDDYNS